MRPNERVHSRHLWASAILLATALAVSALLVIDPAPWRPTTALILAASILSWTAIAIVAILLENSRLGYRLAILVLITCAAIILLHRIIPLWWVAVAGQALAAVGFSDPALGGWVRRRTSATPVPTRAVSLAFVLLTLPGLVAFALAANDPGWLPWLSVLNLVLLFWFARRLPLALGLIRVLPLALAIAGATLAAPARFLWIAGQLAALSLAWTREVRLAVRPLIERGTRVMIPPELAPEEIRQMLEDRG